MTKKMTKKEKKMLAQDLIMKQLSIIGYGDAYQDYIEKVGNEDEADTIMLEQMTRVAKIMGYDRAWFD